MKEPSKILLGLEGVRAIYEYILAWGLNAHLHHIVPKGDGHPVLIIPGLGTADGSTQYLRNFLTNLNYAAYPWGQGRNLGPRKGMIELTDRLTDLISSISRASGDQKVSLIGWSLGGIYAREVAKICPELVRQVITLGTPFKMDTAGTNVDKIYEIISNDKSHKDPAVLSRLRVPPSCPFTSIYSKTDGVVHWECSLEDAGPIYENIEIPAASHLGLGHNPISLYVIANRLAQSPGNWVHYNKI